MALSVPLRPAWLLLAAAFLLLPPRLLAQQVPQYPKFTAAAVTSTSNSAQSSLAAILDGNDNTAWASSANFPTGYLVRSDLNILLGHCASTPSACTSLAGSEPLSVVTDAGTSAGAGIFLPPAGSGPAVLRVTVPGAPLALRRVTFRGIVPANFPVTISLELADGGSVTMGTIAPSQSYSWVAFLGGPSWEGAVAIRLSCAARFTVTELAATAVQSFEQATVDLGAVQAIGVIRTKYWPGGDGLNSTLLASTDGVTFQALANLNPASVGAVTLPFSPPVSARYLAVRHILRETDWAKVYVWGIDAWTSPPSPPPSPPPPSPPAPPPPSPRIYAAGEWNPRAGTVDSMAFRKPVTVSTGADNNVPHITDGQEGTQWQSDACFPFGYASRDDMNPLRQACSQAGRCTASQGSTVLANATDLNVYTGALISLPPGTPAGQPGAFLMLSLPTAATVLRVTYKGFGDAPVDFVLIKADGSTTKAMTVTPAQNYQFVHLDGSWEGVTSVRVQSAGGFTLTEVAVQTGPCLQWAQADLQEVKMVGMIRTKFWSPDANHTALMISTNAQSWTTLQVFPANTLATIEVWLDDLTPVRYIKLVHTVTNKNDWGKVYMWEIQAYDNFGRWGPAPAVVPQWRTFRDLLGVNGIWGWGMKNQSAGVLYNEVASSARNYQNLKWDVRRPQNDPKYETMNKTGTDAMWWLDWGRVYRDWKASNLRVVVTHQFTWEDFTPSWWMPDPYAAAYQLGRAFASFFGPTRNSGNGIVSAIEVGNEPWTAFNATFYSTILSGYVAGAKAGDPALLRLPCALQASNPWAEDANNGNFIGARVSEAIAPDIGALNTHSYSMFTGLDGVRRYVHPEHRGSDLNSLNNFMAWRNNNMPGKPVWVTEWGWDAHLPGEPCMSTECVSQHAQAVYAVRGLMILARKGVDQAHWFFYADGDNCTTTLFCRSGLRGSNDTGFPIKPVYRSLAGFMQLAGSSSFKAVISEAGDVWAYVLADMATGKATHIIAWRPVEVGQGPTTDVYATVQLSLAPGGVVGARPAQAWLINGQGSGSVGYTEQPALPQASTDGQTWTVRVGPAPLLVRLVGTPALSPHASSRPPPPSPPPPRSRPTTPPPPSPKPSPPPPRPRPPSPPPPRPRPPPAPPPSPKPSPAPPRPSPPSRSRRPSPPSPRR